MWTKFSMNSSLQVGDVNHILFLERSMIRTIDSEGSLPYEIFLAFNLDSIVSRIGRGILVSKLEKKSE